MSKMKITFPPPDIGKPDFGDFITSFILLSKQKGVKCELIFPTEAIIEGNRETLLEILDELDNKHFGNIDKNVGISVEFDESDYKTFTRMEDSSLRMRILEEAESKKLWQTQIPAEMSRAIKKW